MRGPQRGLVQASGATIVLEHGNEAAVRVSLTHLGALGLLLQMQGWEVLP
jgi:hypothetical protein